MDFFKHRHVVVAAIVAPLLALMAWFSIDFFVGEKPAPAQEGASYPLTETPGCRYPGGRCELKNGDFELALALEPADGFGLVLSLTSIVPLQGVRVGLAAAGEEMAEPVAMQPTGPEAREWRVTFGRLQVGEDRLRLVASAGGALYFGEAATAFAAAPQSAGSE